MAAVFKLPLLAVKAAAPVINIHPESSMNNFSFENLGWWSIPIGAVVGAVLPFTLRGVRGQLARGEIPISMALGTAAAGALAAALLTACSKIENRAARTVSLGCGTCIIALVIAFLVVRFFG